MLKLSPTALFARPADTTAYASGDLVANSTTAGSVIPLQISLAAKAGGIVKILRARLKKSGAVITNAQFRVHLYGAAPTVTNGDNGVWLSTEASYLGHFDVTLDKAFSAGSSGVGIPASGAGTFALFKAVAASKNIFALLEARAAYTPVSGETFTLTLEAETE